MSSHKESSKENKPETYNGKHRDPFGKRRKRKDPADPMIYPVEPSKLADD